MSPRPSPCDGFSGSLPSYVDRELAEEHSLAVERHVDGCAACQARLRELEGVSAVLKAWDAQGTAGQPSSARLRHAVLARVEEHGALLRHERRARRMTALAIAASVLAAVGVPLALGLARPAPTAPAPFESLSAGPVSPEPAVEPLEIARLDPERLAPRPSTSPAAPTPPAGASAEEREAFLAGALAAQRQLEEEARFARLTGMRGVWVNDPETGRRLLLTPEAAAAFEPDELLAWLRARRDDTLYSPTVEGPRTTGLTAGDLLTPLLPRDGATAEALSARRLLTFRRPGAAEPMLQLYRLGAADAPAASWPEVLDALLAQAAGTLRLEAAGGDDAAVHAIVEGTTLPILLPAGSLLSGGADDRVLARDAWLPASPAGRHVVQLACVSVRQGARRPEAGVVLTPWIAGPSVRALLARGAPATAVLEQARALRGAAMGGRVPLDWSLLDLFDAPTEARLQGDLRLAQALAGATRGFLAVDGDGKLVGLEALAVGGQGGEALRRRLVHSYEHEARVIALARGASAPSREPLGAALARLGADVEPLIERVVPAPAAVAGVVHAASAPPAAGAVVSALRVDGRRVLVSALP